MMPKLPSDAKDPGYYANTRADLIAELPRPLGRVLDVGCGEGGASEPLKAAGASWIGGIEVVPEVAARAAQRYNRVEVGDALDAIGRFEDVDTVLCYDVLEHLLNPLTVLRELHSRMTPAGRLHVSVPNARHWSLVRDLVLRGTFGYTEWGHRDTTHVRWFTRADLVTLVEQAGFKVLSTTPSAAFRLRELGWRAPGRIVHGLGGEFLAGQWFLLAISNGAGADPNPALTRPAE